MDTRITCDDMLVNLVTKTRGFDQSKRDKLIAAPAALFGMFIIYTNAAHESRVYPIPIQQLGPLNVFLLSVLLLIFVGTLLSLWHLYWSYDQALQAAWDEGGHSSKACQCNPSKRLMPHGRHMQVSIVVHNENSARVDFHCANCSALIATRGCHRSGMNEGCPENFTI